MWVDSSLLMSLCMCVSGRQREFVSPVMNGTLTTKPCGWATVGLTFTVGLTYLWANLNALIRLVSHHQSETRSFIIMLVYRCLGKLENEFNGNMGWVSIKGSGQPWLIFFLCFAMDNHFIKFESCYWPVTVNPTNI